VGGVTREPRAPSGPRAIVAIVVSRADDWADARALAIAASVAGADVAMFVMDAAVRALADDDGALAALAEADVDVVACGTSAHAARLDAAAVGVPLGSQDDHAAMVHRATKVVAFT
jgi:hypothetical protein